MGDGGGVSVIDLSNPTNVYLSARKEGVGSHWYDLCVTGSWLYAASSVSGILVYDITTPTNPVFKASCDTPGIATGLCVDQGFLYVADDVAGLSIIDISTPTNPVFIGSFNLGPGNAGLDVCIRDSFAYVASNFDGLTVLDVSNPTNPVRVAVCRINSQSRGLCLAGNYAYMADEFYGVTVVDIKNPLCPVVVGSYSAPGRTRQVAVSGDFLYAANDNMGLWIFHIYQPAEADTDLDNLPDSWELLWFQDLEFSSTSDADGDGMPNWAELFEGTNPNATDTDGDGMTDLDEINAGCDPTNQVSVFTIVETSLDKDTSYLTLSWNSASNHSYSVCAAQDLTAPFFNIAERILATQSQTSLDIPYLTNTVYYKIELE